MASDTFKGEGKTMYTFSVSVNAFSVEFPLACYQQAGRVWYVSGALRRTYTLFYPAPTFMSANYLFQNISELFIRSCVLTLAPWAFPFSSNPHPRSQGKYNQCPYYPSFGQQNLQNVKKLLRAQSPNREH